MPSDQLSAQRPSPKSTRTLPPRIAIVGRPRDTANYEAALRSLGASFLTTMDPGALSACDALLLPGGGDITPAFFGQKNQGSRNIDVELDITQLQALDLFVKWKRPVLGICKGMQVINVYFGGTVIQDMPKARLHAWDNADRFHSTHALPHCFPGLLYGERFLTNSAHHQEIGILGHSLKAVQWSDDGAVEALEHETLPILGVQWHPERLFTKAGHSENISGSPENAPENISHSPAGAPAREGSGIPPVISRPCDAADGQLLFEFFLSLCAPAAPPSPALPQSQKETLRSS